MNEKTPKLLFDPAPLLATLTDLPGVYRMLNDQGCVLYVGKAKNLRKRVSSYFRGDHASPRIALMVSQISEVEITVTRTEAEALLLESNLIKELAPRYNILFRDDKSYPYIVMTRDPYPRLGFFRGSTDKKSNYFGPFPSSSAVRESINLLQKMFRLRTCEDSVFSNRSRPCLLHQIRRCSGPCVGLLAPENYAEDVRMAELFLGGQHREIIVRLNEAMDKASSELAFEQAAVFRDQIQSLQQVQEKQHVASVKGEDADIVAAVEEGGLACINLAMVRGGRHLGDRAQFPSNANGAPVAEIISAFLTQHYISHRPSPRIYLNVCPAEDELGQQISALAGYPVQILSPRQKMHKSWVDMARKNALLAILTRRNLLARQESRLEALFEFLGLDIEENSDARIECFDISHTSGESTVASCVVFQAGTMQKSHYRRFNVSSINPGDDYAAIRQAVLRRYEKVAIGEGVSPDLILIDGGKGQVSSALSALEELGLSHFPLVGVSKGVERKAGLEQLVFPDEREAVQLGHDHPALQLIQEIRDEAHRFAITGHRAKRSKTRKESRLDQITGVGPKRRKALISFFGGLQGITGAGVEQLATVPGISRELAKTIYTALH